jgi:hypothetical protein
LNEHFAEWARSLPKPTPSPRHTTLSPEEVQRQLDQYFGHLNPTAHWLESRLEPAPPPKLTPEEIQRALDEAFAVTTSRPELAPSPRAIRNMQRSLRRGSAKPAPWDRAGHGRARRRRCDARVKNLFKICKNGVRVSRGLFCRAWAMESGRCWVHGGASTGPRTPEGKARVVAAMVEGRRNWAARQRAAGKKFPAGRKRDERWVTEPMRERARAEAHRLKGARFTLDRALALALLASAKGDHVGQAKAGAMLDAQEQAAVERDRQSPPTEARLRSALADIEAELRALRASP